MPLIKDYLKHIGEFEKPSDPYNYSNSTTPFDKKEQEIYEELVQLRIKISNQSQIESNNILFDYTIKEIARFKPINKAQLLAINGIEEKNYNWFGSRILEVVAKYV